MYGACLDLQETHFPPKQAILTAIQIQGAHPQCPKLLELAQRVPNPVDANFIFCMAPEW